MVKGNTDCDDMPERIWLIPNAGNDGETLWCDDPAPGTGMDPDDAVEYRRADLCASGQQVRVKPLEWEPSKTSYTQADCVLGQYQISFLGEFECWQLSAPHKPGSDWKDGFTRHASKSAAKAAAQADYERRILAALTPAPQTDKEAHRNIPAEPNRPEETLYDRGYVWGYRHGLRDAATPTAQEAEPTSGTEREAFDFAMRVYKETGVTPDLRRVYDFYKKACNEHQPSGTVAEAEPVAARWGFDGYGWTYYLDNGSGSDWLKRATQHDDVQMLYSHPPQPSDAVAEAIAALEALNVIKTGPWCGGYISRKAALRALRALKGDKK